VTTTSYSYREYPAAGRQFAFGEKARPFGIEWRRARKGTLKFMPHAVQFEEWSIPYNSVQKAEVIRPADLPFLDELSSVLRLSAGDVLYEFRVNSFGFSRSEFPFAVERTREPALEPWMKVVALVATLALVLGFVLGRRLWGW